MVDRIGQKAKTVVIQYMVGRGTADDVMLSSIHRKQSTLKSTVGEMVSRVAKLAVMLPSVTYPTAVFVATVSHRLRLLPLFYEPLTCTALTIACTHSLNSRILSCDVRGTHS